MIINSQQSLATQEEVALSKVNVQKEAAKKSFCKKNNNFFINNLKKDHYPSKIEIKTNKVKTWYINLIKSFIAPLDLSGALIETIKNTQMQK